MNKLTNSFYQIYKINNIYRIFFLFKDKYLNIVSDVDLNFILNLHPKKYIEHEHQDWIKWVQSPENNNFYKEIK